MLPQSAEQTVALVADIEVKADVERDVEGDKEVRQGQGHYEQIVGRVQGHILKRFAKCFLVFLALEEHEFQRTESPCRSAR